MPRKEYSSIIASINGIISSVYFFNWIKFNMINVMTYLQLLLFSWVSTAQNLQLPRIEFICNNIGSNK